MTESKPIDMRALSIFLAAAETGSMSAAGTAIGISQSGVSQAIRMLEEDLGTVLFDRARRPITLTAAGLALRNRGSVLLDQTHILRGTVLEASQGLKPDLRLGLVDSFAGTFGSHLIKLLLQRVTQLSVRTGLTPNLTEALIRREFDLVVSTDPLDDIGGVTRHSLLTERFVVIVPRASSVELNSGADLRRLAEAMTIVRFNSHSHLGMQVERLLRRTQVRASRRLEVDTADTLTSMVAGGIGWAVTTPLCLLQAAQFSKAVRVLPMPVPAAVREIFLLTREDEAPRSAAEVVSLTRQVFRTQIAGELAAIDPRLMDQVALTESDDDDH